MSKKGRKVTPETKAKLSVALKKKWQDPEFIRKHSGENNARYGKPYSPEIGAKISAMRKIRCQDPVVRANISEGQKRRFQNPSEREKIGVANRNRDVSPETRAKMSASHTGVKRPDHAALIAGENNPNWHGGSSFLPYSLDWTTSLKRSIRERDHYTCRLCGEPQGDMALDVHHIDYNKQNCDPSNLISLCHSCHTRTIHDREYWTQLFSLLLAA